MNKKAYYRKLIEIREAFETPHFAYLFKVLNIFQPPRAYASNLDFPAITSGSTESANKRAELTRLVANAIELDKSKVSPRKLTRCELEIKEFMEHVCSSEHVPDLIVDRFNKFEQLMDQFLDSHERYRLNFNASLAYRLSERSEVLIGIRNEIEFIIESLLVPYQSQPESDERENLEIYLGNVPTLGRYGAKLQVLDDLYTEVANLCGISLTDFPVVVEHLENGSLLARLSGHPLVVSLLTLVISTTSNHLIGQYLQNGSVTELNEKVETLDNMYELSKKLAEEGYDVGDMQDDINRSLKKLAKSSNVLLSDQAEIEVNDEVFKLDPENATKLLQETKRLEAKEVDQEA